MNMSQEFDNKMTQLMAENERRLREILRLQEDRYAGILASKADKENI